MNGKEFLVAMTNLDEDLIMDVMPRKIEKLRSAKRMTRWHSSYLSGTCRRKYLPSEISIWKG